MSRFKVTDPCILPSCSRQRKSSVPLCARCWAEADDGERAGVLFAIHAPFFPHYIAGTKEDERPGDGVDPMSVVTAPHGYLRFGGIYAGAVLREYEQRTTLRAIADSIRFRRMSNPEAADLPHEEEDPHDQA